MKRELRLGTNRGKPRLWLEGTVLRENGFLRGEPFVLDVGLTRIVLTIGTIDDAGPPMPGTSHRSQRRVSGKSKKAAGRVTDHPIIDINVDLLDPFADQDLLLVATPGSIVIRPAK